jgi:hypothetical protein
MTVSLGHQIDTRIAQHIGTQTGIHLNDGKKQRNA